MGKMKAKVRIVVAAVALFLVTIPLFAHHGTNISYDHEHPIIFKATVTEFVFKRPHAQIFFDVKDDKGEIVHWSGELTDPINLARNGWTKRRSEAELTVGTPVTITVFPSKMGTTVGVVSRIFNEKGEQILLGRDAQ